MATCKYNRIKKYVLSVVCEGPLRIGNAFGQTDGVLVRATTGMPFIQATSINGVMRAFCESQYGDALANELFGPSSEEKSASNGRLKIMDADFDSSTLKMEIRPHVSIDKETGTVASSNSSGQKYDIEYVGVGSEAIMYIYLYEDSERPVAEKFEMILAAMQKGSLLFGAKKSNGAGKLRLIKAEYKLYNLASPEGRCAWMDEEHETKYDELKLDGLVDTVVGAFYEISISGKSEGAIQVKGQAVNEFGEDAPDSTNIRNARKEYIVPGSSFKGAIRSRMEKIADYVGNTGIIHKSFGKVGETQIESYSGNLVFSDAGIGTIEDNDKNDNRNRIHIDKFTGGVFHGGKFAEKNACGDITFHITVRDNCSEEEAKASLGVLLLALRDLACGLVSVGNGYATGKGIILVNEVKIFSKEKQAILRFDDGKMVIEGHKPIIEEAMKAIQQGA